MLGGATFFEDVVLQKKGPQQPSRKDIAGASTQIREAYFLQYAKSIRAAMRNTPLMVTGGLRSASVMADALQSECDMVGVGRPLCGDPHCVDKLLDGAVKELPRYENELALPAVLQFLMRFTIGRMMLVGGVQGWYYQQLVLLGQTGAVSPTALSTFSTAMFLDSWDEKCAAKLKGPELEGCVGQVVNAPKRYTIKIVGALVLAIACWFRYSY
eukprot:TRINITY_DN11666_c0_g1_i2.p1 TRINITY_DN11666_c0_g1~~TRINITY_DN11666_c0_g1_i2.p1  ORF type:complete len:213 (+),score=50.59 TRINITY_DN11666_c0_g1_i2:1010-1648(+)